MKFGVLLVLAFLAAGVAASPWRRDAATSVSEGAIAKDDKGKDTSDKTDEEDVENAVSDDNEDDDETDNDVDSTDENLEVGHDQKPSTEHQTDKPSGKNVTTNSSHESEHIDDKDNGLGALDEYKEVGNTEDNDDEKGSTEQTVTEGADKSNVKNSTTADSNELGGGDTEEDNSGDKGGVDAEGHGDKQPAIDAANGGETGVEGSDATGEGSEGATGSVNENVPDTVMPGSQETGSGNVEILVVVVEGGDDQDNGCLDSPTNGWELDGLDNSRQAVPNWQDPFDNSKGDQWSASDPGIEDWSPQGPPDDGQWHPIIPPQNWGWE